MVIVSSKVRPSGAGGDASSSSSSGAVDAAGLPAIGGSGQLQPQPPAVPKQDPARNAARESAESAEKEKFEEEVRKSFRFFLRKYDNTSSGVLSTPHFRIILTQMGSGAVPMSEDQIATALHEIDPEERGYVDEKAFVAWVLQNRK